MGCSASSGNVKNAQGRKKFDSVLVRESEPQDTEVKVKKKTAVKTDNKTKAKKSVRKKSKKKRKTEPKVNAASAKQVEGTTGPIEYDLSVNINKFLPSEKVKRIDQWMQTERTQNALVSPQCDKGVPTKAKAHHEVMRRKRNSVELRKLSAQELSVLMQVETGTVASSQKSVKLDETESRQLSVDTR